ncbi:olfactory receptor 5P66-like [Pelobates fuscus]|uniref:olfactory receptor 5P66-like n=1 Tax=Pelobates fuscus TaxID=191477 RepID=UPI002FE47856
MCENNQSKITEFILLGFQDFYNLKMILFMLIMLIYILILSENLLIIVLLTTSDHLKFPMFYFIKHLALADVIFPTTVVPLMLDVILKNKRRVSVAGCITQLHLCGVSVFSQCFLLAAMSYDRYMAILKPLHYSLIMNPNVCLALVAGSWLIVFIFISSGMIFVWQLQFCGQSYINHFYCDVGPVAALSTSDISSLVLHELLTSVFMVFVPFVFIIITYALIFFSIIRIPSTSGRRKCFSTCSSHLTSVCTFYVTLLIVYLIPSEEDKININKFRSLLYILVTPLLNPIIYSLKNKEIRGALRKLLKYNSINN